VVAVGVVVVLAVSFLSSSPLKTPPMARPPTISAIRTTAASAIHGAFEPPVWRPGGPPIGPPAKPGCWAPANWPAGGWAWAGGNCWVGGRDDLPDRGGALGGAALDRHRRLADAHLIARAQRRGGGDAVAVHESSVGRAEVLDDQLARGVVVDPGVDAGDLGVSAQAAEAGGRAPDDELLLESDR
jgi:hypothetical protein